MHKEINAEQQLVRIAEYLEKIDARSPDRATNASEFVDNYILDDQFPITYLLAANYLKWVLGKGEPKEDTLRPCRTCVAGWVEKADGTVYPCGNCRNAQYNDFWQTVDEDEGPR